MIDAANYLVTEEIAIRSGMVDSRYRIADGRFVLNNRDLNRVRFRTDEYINGLAGVEKVSEEEARTLIARNGYRLGRDNSKAQPILDAEPMPDMDAQPLEPSENSESSESSDNSEYSESSDNSEYSDSSDNSDSSD